MPTHGLTHSQRGRESHSCGNNHGCARRLHFPNICTAVKKSQLNSSAPSSHSSLLSARAPSQLDSFNHFNHTHRQLHTVSYLYSSTSSQFATLKASTFAHFAMDDPSVKQTIALIAIGVFDLCALVWALQNPSPCAWLLIATLIRTVCSYYVLGFWIARLNARVTSMENRLQRIE